MKSLFFIHIPKTAGTSFRIAAQKHFGFDKVLCDYGAKEPETSELVKQLAYHQLDHWALYNEIEREGIDLLAGHIPASRYLGGYGARKLVTFLRDPVQRLISEYQHFLRLKNYSRSFREFFNRPIKINQLSKNISPLQPEAVGLLGLTDRYSESLELINSVYNLDLKVLEENMGRGSVGETHDIDPEELRELEALNQKDIALYQQAEKLFEVRYSLFRKNLPFSHCRMVEVSAKRVAGWAYWEGATDEPVALQVRVNGCVVSEALATHYRASLSSWLPPRGSHVGFSTGIEAAPGDKIDCVVKATGQVFPSKPIVLPESRGSRCT